MKLIKTMDYKRKIQISPSLMCADTLNIREYINFFNKNADFLHVDIMDGHFVKNIVFSPKYVKDISQIAEIPIDCHLMVTNPEDFVDAFIESGATYISLHAETIYHNAFRLIQRIHECNKKVGIVISPSTPLSFIKYYAHLIDKLTFMTVDPGYAGQKFIDSVLVKMQEAIDFRKQNNFDFLIEADGQANKSTYKKLYENGNEVFIVGASGLFNLDSNISTAWSIMQTELNNSINV